MVESKAQLDTIFGSLADKTRRDILRRVITSDLTISEIAKTYDMSFAGVAKHVAVLEKARLVRKRRNGKEQIISAHPKSIIIASSHLEHYIHQWQERFDRLEVLLDSEKN